MRAHNNKNAVCSLRIPCNITLVSALIGDSILIATVKSQELDARDVALHEIYSARFERIFPEPKTLNM